MNRAPKFQIILLAIAVICDGLMLKAQPPSNKPTTATQVPGPTQSVAIPSPGYIINGQNPVINYVRIRQAMGRISDESSFASAAYSDVMESSSYTDGLGRTI